MNSLFPEPQYLVWRDINNIVPCITARTSVIVPGTPFFIFCSSDWKTTPETPYQILLLNLEIGQRPPPDPFYGQLGWGKHRPVTTATTGPAASSILEQKFASYLEAKTFALAQKLVSWNQYKIPYPPEAP